MAGVVPFADDNRVVATHRRAGIKLEPWMVPEYEQRIRHEAHAMDDGLTLWMIRRIDYIFGNSPYGHIPRAELPAEHFGNLC